MKLTKKLTCLLLSTVMLLTMLIGCGTQEEHEEKFTLNVCVCDNIESLDPAMNTDSAAQSVFYTLFENLMRYTGNGSGGAELSPGIAKEYTETENYDGSVTYRFALRSSARWSDGEDVTANDFVYAWRRLADPATNSPNASILEMVSGYDEVRSTGDVSYLAVSAKNDTTFEVTLSKPCSYFIEGVCTAVATMPLRKDIVEEHPDEWASNVSLVTNGAYHIGTWTQGEHLQTKRNDSYYEGKLVGPDAIRFLFAANSQQAYELYENEEVDCVSQLPERVVAELEGQQNMHSVSLGETYCVLYNNYTDIFSDSNVRAAFDLAIDRASIAEVVGVTANAASGLVPFGIPNGSGEGDDFRTSGGELCALDEEGYAERCRNALSKLTLAGYYQGDLFPNLEYIYDGSDPTAMAVAMQLQQMWADALHVAITPVAISGEELESRLQSGDYYLAGTSMRANYNDAMSFMERFEGNSEGNFVNYHSETYDILMGVADKSDNLIARTAFLHDAEAMLLGESVLSPLFFRGSCGLLRESLSGIYFDSVGRCYLTGISKTVS